MSVLLLDTCAAIWLTQGEPIAAQATEAIDACARKGAPLFVSPMSGWEIGMLVSRGRLTITMDPEAWFERLLAVPGVALADLNVSTLIASSFLPGAAPRDPVDRILAATAREGGYHLVTRDRRLLDYAEEGHLSTIAC